MRFLSRFLFAWILLILCACSVWQSEGRKFLEKQAFEYTGAQAYLLNCADPSKMADWNPVTELNQAQVYRANSKIQLRVVPSSPRPFACDYQFQSEPELMENIPGAVENAWQHFRNFETQP